MYVLGLDRGNAKLTSSVPKRPSLLRLMRLSRDDDRIELDRRDAVRVHAADKALDQTAGA